MLRYAYAGKHIYVRQLIQYAVVSVY